MVERVDIPPGTSFIGGHEHHGIAGEGDVGEDKTIGSEVVHIGFEHRIDLKQRAVGERRGEVGHRRPAPRVKLEVRHEAIVRGVRRRRREILEERDVALRELGDEDLHLVHVPLVHDARGAVAAHAAQVQVARAAGVDAVRRV